MKIIKTLEDWYNLNMNELGSFDGRPIEAIRRVPGGWVHMTSGIQTDGNNNSQTFSSECFIPYMSKKDVLKYE